jgi:hypothetical protein
MRTAIPVTISAAIIVAVALAVALESGEQRAADTVSPAEQRTIVVPDAWQQYTSERVGIAMQVPPTARTDIERNQLKVQVIGPNNRPNTEVTDGLTFYARRFAVDRGTSSLRALAFALYERANERGEVAVKPRATTTATGAPAYRFTVRGAIGTASVRHVIRANAETAFVTTALVTDPHDRGYQHMVRLIRSSMRPIAIEERGRPITISKRFQKKLVYTTAVATNTAPYRSHCEAVGGTFNACGRACASGADACPSMCALTCRFTPSAHERSN